MEPLSSMVDFNAPGWKVRGFSNVCRTLNPSPAEFVHALHQAWLADAASRAAAPSTAVSPMDATSAAAAEPPASPGLANVPSPAPAPGTHMSHGCRARDSD